MHFALAAPASGGFNPSMLILLIGFPLLFYFMLIRPQNQQRKAQEERLSKLKAGDEVILAGGLFATIDRVEEKVIFVKLGNSVVKARRTAVVSLASENLPEQQ